MRRGPKNRPTELKVIDGNPGNRRLNKREPKPELGLVFPPGNLSKEELAIWNDAAPQLFRAGVLTPLDAAALARYCRAEAMALRCADEIASEQLIIHTEQSVIKNPKLNAAREWANLARLLAAEFGMTPSSRSVVQAHQPGQGEDPTAPLERHGRR